MNKIFKDILNDIGHYKLYNFDLELDDQKIKGYNLDNMLQLSM